MKIGLAQIDCTVGDLVGNTQTMVRYIDVAANAGCNLVMFPELTDTGYLLSTAVEKGAVWDVDGPVMSLRAAAKERGVNVLAGVSERSGDEVFNAIASIDRNGDIASKYRKTHLVTVEPMFEHTLLGQGELLGLGVIDGVDVGFMTCYELRFPEVTRAVTLAGARIVFLPAAFPLVRVGHWNALIKARAIENQLFVVAANRIGTDGPGLTFCGSSQVIDPYGTILGSASEIEEKLLIVDIDLTSVERTRNKMGVLRDRRPELYGSLTEKR